MNKSKDRLEAKYKYWILVICIGLAFILFQNIINYAKTRPSEPKVDDRTIITVNSPKQMHDTFETALKTAEKDTEYKIEFVDDSNANFVVAEGLVADGELIAYSPFIVFVNSDKDFRKELKEKEIFVKSEIDTDFDDFDFKKLIDEILSDNSDLKVYYPDKDTLYWEEFYNLLLYTVNDGFYPKNSDMASATEKIEAFLGSKNAIPVKDVEYKKIHGVTKNAIYFTTYFNIAQLYKNKTISYEDFIVRYPKTVVYHGYYASFDKNGKILFDALEEPMQEELFESKHQGYKQLAESYYDSKYYKAEINNYIAGARDEYNSVEILEENNITTNGSFEKEE